MIRDKEQKTLYDAFTQAGEDADVGFALSALQEVIERHE